MSTTAQLEKSSTPNLYQRIRSVMEDVGYLRKDDQVGSGNYSYKGISEEKVTETIRVSLIRHGLVILPVEQSHSLTDFDRGGKITSLSTVDTRYKIVNVDDPSQFEYIVSSGTGVDPQDKGVGKAMTYSYKYLMLRTFAIPTGEDPDKIHNSELEKEQTKAAKAAAEKSAANALQTALQEVEACTDGECTKAVWNKYPQFKAEEAFKKAVAEKGKTFKVYATPAQKGQLTDLLNDPHIKNEEKTKLLLRIHLLSSEEAEKAIQEFRDIISERLDASGK